MPRKSQNLKTFLKDHLEMRIAPEEVCASNRELVQDDATAKENAHMGGIELQAPASRLSATTPKA